MGMRTMFSRVVYRANKRSFSVATFDPKLWSKWRDELPHKSMLYRRVVGQRNLGDDNDGDRGQLTDELQSFWDDVNELVRTFGTPELDDQVRFLTYWNLPISVYWNLPNSE